MTTTQIVAMTFEEKRLSAESIAKSNLFGIQTTDQALSLMLLAEAEGLHPATAARDYHLIKGRPSLKSDAMLARHLRSGGKVEWLQYTDEGVEAKFTHPQGGSVTVDWGPDRARKAGLTTSGMYNKFPRQMFRARCISEGVRTVNPGIVVGLYTPEEVVEFDKPEAPSNPRDVTPPKPPVVPKPKEGTRDDWEQFAAGLSTEITKANTQEEVNALVREANGALAQLKKAHEDLYQNLTKTTRATRDRITQSEEPEATEPEKPLWLEKLEEAEKQGEEVLQAWLDANRKGIPDHEWKQYTGELGAKPTQENLEV